MLKALVVEDDVLLRKAMVSALRTWGAEVSDAGTEKEGITALAMAPDLLITDVRLEKNGSGIRVVEAAVALKPTPLMIAISGKATALESFRLAQAGVVAYIAKPIDFIHFVATIEVVIANPPEIMPHVAAQIGRRSYHDILRRVRKTMLEQALARTSGNRVQASKLLAISRQAVQQLIRDFDLNIQHSPAEGIN